MLGMLRNTFFTQLTSARVSKTHARSSQTITSFPQVPVVVTLTNFLGPEMLITTGLRGEVYLSAT